MKRFIWYFKQNSISYNINLLIGSLKNKVWLKFAVCN